MMYTVERRGGDTMFQKIYDYVTGKGKLLTLQLTYPESKRLIFERLGGKTFRISDEPTKTYALQSASLVTDTPQPRVSAGAIVGARWAAFRGGDVLKGAVIGDELERQSDKQARQYHFVFREVTSGEDRLISVKLTLEQLKVLKGFFGMR